MIPMRFRLLWTAWLVLFGILVMLVVSIPPVVAADASRALPQEFEHQLMLYRDYGRPLTIPEMAKLKLSLDVIQEPIVVLNYWRNLRRGEGRAVLEQLEAGTIVLRSPGGQPGCNPSCGH